MDCETELKSLNDFNSVKKEIEKRKLFIPSANSKDAAAIESKKRLNDIEQLI
eukprot:SAG22_NODE_424_length_10663_cov_93.402026_19_plen_52_part_00